MAFRGVRGGLDWTISYVNLRFLRVQACGRGVNPCSERQLSAGMCLSVLCRVWCRQDWTISYAHLHFLAPMHDAHAVCDSSSCCVRWDCVRATARRHTGGPLQPC